MVKVPKFIKKIFYNQVWDIPNSENKIYLTFDDGPTPLITEWVLEILEKENIKATFFCIGNNIEKYPEIFKKIIEAGHSIGNHTFNHLKGWKVTSKKYLKNVDLCEAEICKLNTEHSKLFRPPYGKITPIQSKLIRMKGFKIIMWDILSKDYDQAISFEKCLENTKRTASGSILVFHDSLKAQKNLEYTLPKAIKYLKEKGFVFDAIN
ncbi:polysaccharide deacetylase family protein [uncultured Flavobacterium sp.]|uniref:polysaccharide deacetylase family protein n=1 Tax=uncultured Flavobacterium sp. TaxID=165435 RepID=UPI0030EC934B|tara:strand:+ start:63991 stop:64614 length:624 start_codon:yes stop_codon:yes gene_type:complete